MDVPVKPEANAGADVREPARRRQPGLSRSDADIQQRLVADNIPPLDRTDSRQAIGPRSYAPWAEVRR